MVCIYSIRNKINNKIYVGQAEDYWRRKEQHISKLIKNIHPVKQLQEDYNLYCNTNKNLDNVFIFNIEQQCNIEELDDLERYYIQKLNSFEDNGGYNATTGGKSNFNFSKIAKNKMSIAQKEKFKNDKEYYDKIINHNRKMAKDPEHLYRLQNMAKLYYTDETLAKRSKASKANWTEEKRQKKSQEMIEKFKDPEERRKRSEATKAGMAKMTKEQKSRRHLSKVPVETLIQMTKERHLTQNEMKEKYNVTISLAKGIKAKKHWIYEYMEENNIPIE